MRKERNDLNAEVINTVARDTATKRKKKKGHPKLSETRKEDGQEQLREDSFEEKDVKQKQKKSKKRMGLLQPDQSLLNHEELHVFTESVQVSQANGEKEDEVIKKKRKRDRWGQKIHDSDEELGTISFVEKKTTNVNQAVLQDEGLLRHEDQYHLKKVCVSGIPYDMTEEDILRQFANCGTVMELNCSRFTDTQRFNGLAFITFETEMAARKALNLDGAEMGGRFIKIEQARKKERVFREQPKKIEGCLSAYIGNLAWDVQQIDIKRFFKGCRIDSVRLALDKATGEFRGYGHVDFADDVSLERGIKLNQKQLFGRPMKVAYVVPKGFQSNKGIE